MNMNCRFVQVGLLLALLLCVSACQNERVASRGKIGNQDGQPRAQSNQPLSKSNEISNSAKTTGAKRLDTTLPESPLEIDGRPGSSPAGKPQTDQQVPSDTKSGESRSSGPPLPNTADQTVRIEIGENQDKSKSVDEGPASPLDQAVEALNNKTVENPRSRQPLQPRDVHDALKPLIQKTWTRLHPAHEIWLDMKNKQVIVGGRICQRDAPLEMFACPAGSKEHESIVGTISDARTIHAGLLAVGAVPGHVVQYDPKYVPARGTEISVNVVWTEDGERKQRTAQEMILDRKTGEHLKHKWVFCGSGEWTDPDTRETEYFADFGDMICVSNFTTAMMDLTIASSEANSELRFNAYTEKVPSVHTPVLLILKPELTTGEGSNEKSEEEKAEEQQANDDDDG